MRLTLPRALVLCGIGIAVLVTTSSLAEEFGRGALRQVVRACSVAKSTLGVSFPCTEVRPATAGADGYVLLRSPGFASEFLLAPTAPIDGIESPQLRADAATHFWRAAWAARTQVEAALGRKLPRDAVGLAVNALGTRTQDHFHIHVDCVSKRVEDTLAAHAAGIGEDWTQLPVRLRGDVYWARAVATPDLDGINIPGLMAASPPATHTPMDDSTVAVVPATLKNGAPGFYVLANWTDASAEALLDHRCRGR